jgi:hypothetical protein
LKRKENTMKIGWLTIGLAALTIASDPALARVRHPGPPPVCVDSPRSLSLEGFLFNPRPQPNGCAPPVYQYGRYIGQDPDPFIRFQLNRDPATGYTSDLIK